MARINYKMYPTDYVNELFKNGKRDKAKCFLEYFHDMQMDEVNAISFYSKSWGKKGNGTASKWIEEFKNEIESFYNYWSLKNTTHHSSVIKKSGRKVDELKSESGRNNIQVDTTVNEFLEVGVDEIKSESGRKVEQDINIEYINNINAESNDSATEKYSNNKNTYSDKFEIIWNLYDKKTSNKNRAYSIYKKRHFQKLDIEILKGAIEKYKEKTNITFVKDFDGFLNGLIDSYLPKKCWLVDRQDRRYEGLFFDCDNKFVTDGGKSVVIDSNNIAEYIQTHKFGFIAA